MGRIRNWLNRLLPGKREAVMLDVEELRLDFKARNHNFKQLLNANNRSLDIMAEIEGVLGGIEPFSMTFVRSRCTQVSTQVFRIVKYLGEIASGKYGELFERFESIRKEIDPYLQAKDLPQEGPMVVRLTEIDRTMAGLVGGKMANLADIQNRLQMRVPEGFVVTATGYRRFMEHNDLQPEINRRLQAADISQLDHLYDLSKGIQQLIVQSELPDDLRKVLGEECGRLPGGSDRALTFAVRSSALMEDSGGISFAGQYKSLLNVSGDSIFDAYKEVVSSKYSLTAMTYRLNRGIPDENVAMCVGFLCMVDAVSGGVVYSRNPVDRTDDSIVINAVWGLPKPVVDGRLATDLYVLSRGNPPRIMRKEIAVKDSKFVCYPEEGVCRLSMTGDEKNAPSLGDGQALDLARIAMQLDEYHQIPQDIEWAVDEEGRITLLQCRQLHQRVSPAKSAIDGSENSLPGSTLLQGGITASPGAAAGPVFKVQKYVEALRFPEGAVLVTGQALPRWATLLGRAAAVVSERGGVAGHLANVAREFGIPALFGVGQAMDRLDNERIVTVDADGRAVFPGRIEILLGRQPKPRNLMEGSPVFERFKAAARHIVPLNLLDPDAPSFKAERCRTFHDITRFCHEKAVDEMFRFGKEHRFPERSSKQLYCEVPMQWWILNLDDGFKEEVEGKYVRIENIASIPMLALWDGITAIPWEGPPPIDRKGLMSVMFEATRNTSLTPGVRSQYANRNYFMISKNYCSLNSRLGFHFSTIESMVSDRPQENYLSFQFKGGAADFDRRLKRVLLVADILEEYGFHADIKEDTLIARVENYDMKFMEGRLKILGYLTIHSRQLDMIMANASAVDLYRAKIDGDIRSLLAL